MKDIEKRTKWLTENGFTADGITYCLIAGDTYSIKDVLKENGYKFNSSLKWHGAEKLNLPESYVYLPMSVEDYFIWNPDLEAYFVTESGKAFLNEKTMEISPYRFSNYIGEIGAQIIEQASYIGRYVSDKGRWGTQYIHNFMRKNDVITWITTNPLPNLKLGETIYLKAKVKNHELYNNIKTTYITRATVLRVGSDE